MELVIIHTKPVVVAGLIDMLEGSGIHIRNVLQTIEESIETIQNDPPDVVLIGTQHAGAIDHGQLQALRDAVPHAAILLLTEGVIESEGLTNQVNLSGCIPQHASPNLLTTFLHEAHLQAKQTLKRTRPLDDTDILRKIIG